MAECRITKEVRVPGAHNTQGGLPPKGEKIELESNYYKGSSRTIDESRNFPMDPAQQEGNVEREGITKKKNRKNAIKSWIWKWGFYICVLQCALLVLTTVGLIVGFFVVTTYQKSILVDPKNPENPKDPGPSVLGLLGSELPETGKSKMQLNLGIRNDFLLQDCKDRGLKKSFPDLDYVLLGYHILKGYPMAIGHDPGFTNPIFEADYSTNRQTGDCKFSIPTGYTVIPDVSCQTSMSSKVVKNSQDLKASMGISAKINGGGWGVSFGASTDYKKASQTVQSGEKVMVISTATCQYYYARINEITPPPFTDSFIKALTKLNNSDTDTYINDYLDFITYWGTHYMKMVTFGARFMKEHSMSSSSYSSMSSSSLSVEAMASYSGFGVNVGGSFGLSSSQSAAVSKFQQSVETKTITVGSPPPSNGDAMTWASSVKETPVPFSYEMESIEELLTPTFMANYPDIDYEKLRRNLDFIKSRYPRLIYKRALQGESTCRVYDAPFEVPDFYFPSIDIGSGRTNSYGNLNIEQCSQKCFESSDCLAVDIHESQCHSTTSSNLNMAPLKDAWTTIFPYKMVVNARSNYKDDEVVAKFFLKSFKVKVNKLQSVFDKCDVSDGKGDKCVQQCVEKSDCVMAYQIKHPTQSLYCCGLVDEFDVQDVVFEKSSDSNEYIVFIKTKC